MRQEQLEVLTESTSYAVLNCDGVGKISSVIVLQQTKKKGILTKAAGGVKTRKVMCIPNPFCCQVVGYALRNHLHRNGSQLLKAAFAAAFLLAFRISNLILQAAEEQLQVCVGMTEWTIYAISIATKINVLTKQPAEEEGQGHAKCI